MTFLTQCHALEKLEGHRGKALGSSQPYFANEAGEPTKKMDFFACFIEGEGWSIVVPCSQEIRAGQQVALSFGEVFFEHGLKTEDPTTKTIINLSDDADWDTGTLWLKISERDRTSQSETLCQIS